MAFSFSEQDPAVVIREDERMALSVTRHAQNPVIGNFQFLLCGIDSLDLGLYVQWGDDWEAVKDTFQKCKEQAQGTKGFVDKTKSGKTFLHLPSGKAPNYRFHFQFPEYHLFLGISQQAAKSPNVYVSINSETLWRHGVAGAVSLVLADVKGFGGKVQRIQPSRYDLCVDYRIAGGITREFINSHKVARSRSTTDHSEGDQLETFYVGSAKAPIRLRIYYKGKEVQQAGIKLWFKELWETEDLQDIWRVEFQLRRVILKQFRVNDLGDIAQTAGGIWRYLTDSWFSLRLPDDEKTERRTLHSWWAAVQSCDERLGPVMHVERVFQNDAASVDWYVAHVAGCLASYAARLGVRDLGLALDMLQNDICLNWQDKNFETEFIKRSIKIGKSVDSSGGGNGKEE